MEPTTPAPAPTPATPPASSVMNTSFIPASTSFFSKQNGFKILVVILGILIFGELAWAGYTLTRPTSAQVAQQPNVLITRPSPSPASASIVLSGPTEATVGGTLNVNIMINASEQTDGTDVVLNYDPKVLQATAVAPATIYPEYPIKTIDAIKGKISISGVTTPGSTGFSGQGNFGVVTFKTLKSGQATISVDYTPDSTTDSNILGSTASKDILNSVQNLNVAIK